MSVVIGWQILANEKLCYIINFIRMIYFCVYMYMILFVENILIYIKFYILYSSLNIAFFVTNHSAFYYLYKILIVLSFDIFEL